MAAKPVKSVELHYTMIQILIICVRPSRLQAVLYIFLGIVTRGNCGTARAKIAFYENTRKKAACGLFVKVNLPAGCRGDK